MIFYIEKLDITEEKVRLTNHCRYFREVAAEEEAAGRKLGFIAQEMGREINTLGSKANESADFGCKDEGRVGENQGAGIKHSISQTQITSYTQCRQTAN